MKNILMISWQYDSLSCAIKSVIFIMRNVILYFLAGYSICYAEIDLSTKTDSGYLSSKPNASPQLIKEPVAGHINILWDTFHGVIFGYAPSERFSVLTAMLEGNGYVVDENNVGVVNQSLNGYKIVVISVTSAWDSPYSADEVSVLSDFAYQGGSLLIMGDNPDTEIVNIQNVAAIVGVSLGTSDISPIDTYITNTSNHSVFSGTTQLFLRAAGGITTTPPSTAIAWADTGEEVIAAVEYGLGKVIVFGESNIFDNDYIGVSDNNQFASNVFQWLSEASTPQKPQISVSDGYIKLDAISGVPPSTDCEYAQHNGRMVLNDADGGLYICTSNGWLTK